MMSETEKKLRLKLAVSHHIIFHCGWSDLLATHLSARLPDTNHILITPMDVPFEEVTDRALFCL